MGREGWLASKVVAGPLACGTLVVVTALGPGVEGVGGAGRRGPCKEAPAAGGRPASEKDRGARIPRRAAAGVMVGGGLFADG
jgi:hypothetical protein